MAYAHPSTRPLRRPAVLPALLGIATVFTLVTVTHHARRAPTPAAPAARAESVLSQTAPASACVPAAQPLTSLTPERVRIWLS